MPRLNDQLQLESEVQVWLVVQRLPVLERLVLDEATSDSSLGLEICPPIVCFPVPGLWTANVMADPVYGWAVEQR